VRGKPITIEHFVIDTINLEINLSKITENCKLACKESVSVKIFGTLEAFFPPTLRGQKGKSVSMCGKLNPPKRFIIINRLTERKHVFKAGS